MCDLVMHFLPVYGLFMLLTGSFAEQKFHLMKSNINLSFVNSFLMSSIRKPYVAPDPEYFLLSFFPLKSFIVLCFAFKSMINFAQFM